MTNKFKEINEYDRTISLENKINYLQSELEKKNQLFEKRSEEFNRYRQIIIMLAEGMFEGEPLMASYMLEKAEIIRFKRMGLMFREMQKKNDITLFENPHQKMIDFHKETYCKIINFALSEIKKMLKENIIVADVSRYTKLNRNIIKKIDNGFFDGLFRKEIINMETTAAKENENDN